MNKKKSEAINILKRELSRRNFWQFCLYYDLDFFTKRSFLKEVAEAFQDVEEGVINRLSVSMPPRAGKSYITSLFCAWTIGRNPKESVMRNTCTATLYLKFSYDVRNIVKSEKFTAVFGSLLSSDKANLQGWNTHESKQVGYFGAGVGGTIIGFGATKLAITDDLYRGIEDALSDTSNDKILQWKEATHDSRLEKDCASIDIGTRWTKNDVIGRNFEDNYYNKSIEISAIDEEGNSFCEDVKTSEQYAEIQKRISKEIFLAEYQQKPVDIKGRLFSNIKTISSEDYKRFLDQNKQGVTGSIGYIDVSDTGQDFTAMAIAQIVNDKVFIVDYVFTKENTDLSIPLCAEKINKNKCSYIRIESNSMGAMFSRHLSKEIKAKVLTVHNQQNKITRIIMQSATINNDFTFVISDNLQTNQFIDNLYRFTKDGKNKNDDAPDCMAGLSMFIKGLFRNLNL